MQCHQSHPLLSSDQISLPSDPCPENGRRTCQAPMTYPCSPAYALVTSTSTCGGGDFGSVISSSSVHTILCGVLEKLVSDA